MQFPDSINNLNELFESIEKGETYKRTIGDDIEYTKKFSGYYPIGSGNLWHSGVHIEYGSGEIIYPIIPGGEVIAYRLEDKYQECPLPEELTVSQYDNDYTHYASKYDEIIDEGFRYYKLKQGLTENDKTYSVSNNFILIKHQVLEDNLITPLIFYSLYMNLAPVKEKSNNPNEVVHSSSAPFYPDSMCTNATSKTLNKVSQNNKTYGSVSKIGKAGFLRGKRYIDFCIFTEKSLLSYKEKVNVSKIMLFHHFDRNIDLLKKGEKNKSTDFYWPTGTNYEIDERKNDGNNEAFRFHITIIRPLFGENAKINVDYKLNGNKVKILSTENLFLSEKKITNDGTSFQDTEFILTKSLINLEFERVGKSVIAFNLSSEYFQKIEYWCDSINPNNNKILKVYRKNPLLYDYIKVDDIDRSDENLRKILDIENKEIETNDPSLKVFKIKGLTGSSNEELYISKVDKSKCVESALDWNKWFFMNDKDSNKDIICDKTHVFESLIEKFNNEIDEYKYEEDYLEKWWYGKHITNTYLQNALNTDGTGYEFAKKIRRMLRRAVCYHPLEWDKSQFISDNFKNKYNEIVGAPVSKDMHDSLKNESEKSDIWEGLLQQIFGNNCFYFVNPIYFINHLNKANVFEFNPYENYTKQYSFESGTSTGDIKESMTLTVGIGKNSNPGFAPLANVTSLLDKYPNYNGIRYAWCSAPCLIKRWSYASNSVNNILRHTGVDLSPGPGTNSETDIISLIYGEVWAYTNDSATYGNLMIIKELNHNYLYILGHIKKNIKNVGDFVTPGDRVAITGGVGPGSVIYATHLHLEIRECFSNNKDDYLSNSPNYNKPPEIQKGTFKWAKNFGMIYPGPKRFNPFNHEEEYNNIM